jgi:hypothetical protein
MPGKKPVVRVKEADLTHVLAVGEAEIRIPIIEQVRALGYSHWSAGSHKAAINSFKNGLRAAIVVIAMANFNDGRAFAAWVNENHPATTVIFASSDPNASVAGVEEVVGKDVLVQKLPAILNWHIGPAK